MLQRQEDGRLRASCGERTTRAARHLCNILIVPTNHPRRYFEECVHPAPLNSPAPFTSTMMQHSHRTPGNDFAPQQIPHRVFGPSLFVQRHDRATQLVRPAAQCRCRPVEKPPVCASCPVRILRTRGRSACLRFKPPKKTFQTSEEDERVEVAADVPKPGSEVPHMTLTEQLHNCQDLLARAQMAGDKDAIRRFSEHRLSLIQQMAPTSIDPTHAQQSSRY